MRTLMAATALVSMAMATAAEAGDRVVVRGGGNMGGGGWSRPGGGVRPGTPGGWTRPTPPNGGGWTKPNPPHGGGWTKPTPPHGGGQWSKPGGGWNHNGGWAGHGNRPRWGGRIQGRWWAGWQAPGGWGAYQRPVRGWVLPSYWATPGYYINDWSGYGLPQPPVGYNWSRYYDDAVLIDGRGSVYDTIGGVDWDQGDPEGVDYTYYDQSQTYDQGYDGYAYDNGYATPAPVGPGAPYGYPQQDNGLGGAAVGAVVGGVAGAAIAGRDNRLGGALIGGGVGALTGYAIDKNEDRGRVPPAPGYGAGYSAADYGGYPPAVATRAPSPPPVSYHQTAPIVTGGAGTTVVTSGGGGYYSNGYYPGGSVTTITVQSQPVVTTTTTEIWEDAVTYSRPKTVVRKKAWRRAPKCICK